MMSDTLPSYYGGVIEGYCNSIKQEHKTGQASEHSFRPALKTLIENLGKEQDILAINEPKLKQKFHKPDFLVTYRNAAQNVIGHIECKNIDTDLTTQETTNQLKKYRSIFPNLILTNYLTFRLYRNGEQSGIADSDDKAALTALFNAFFIEVAPESPPTITIDVHTIVQFMSKKAHELFDILFCLMYSIDKGENTSHQKGILHQLFHNYRDILIHDMEIIDFADMQAQTIIYGLFAARCFHVPSQGSFSRTSARFISTTPFLQQVFNQISSTALDEKVIQIMDDLSQMLDHTDIEMILKDFGNRTFKDKEAHEEDAVIHFYENFLAAYNLDLRKNRGVYYTPREIVSYIVRSVDHVLRKDFEIKNGLADKTKKVSKDNQAEIPNVLILDPAAGTGTFLFQVMLQIHETMKSIDDWCDYVDHHLLDRLFGFEIMMAPYVMCHLNLAFYLKKTGYEIKAGKKVNVFLTDTLQAPRQRLDLFDDPISHEAYEANAVKRDKPVMVVLGNPPYLRHSINQNQWISALLRGADTTDSEVKPRAVSNYFTVDGQSLNELNPKNLNDDYVKFIRCGQWRIERTGKGILAFITNHGYLTNPTFRGMRQSLMQTFDEIYLLDLHGNERKSERTSDGSKDGNVFAIQQGVAIGIFVTRNAKKNRTPARIFHAEMWGTSDSKYHWLKNNDISNTKWTELYPKSPLYLFIPYQERRQEVYETGNKITTIMPAYNSGITTCRDNFALAFDELTLIKRINDMGRTDLSDSDFSTKYNIHDTNDWDLKSARAAIQKDPDYHKPIQPYLYRSFDHRFCIFSDKVMTRSRKDFMQHMVAGKNLALIMARQVVVTSFTHIFITRDLVDFNIHKGSGVIFPLYLYPPDSGDSRFGQRHPNFNNEFITDLTTKLHLDFIPDHRGDLQKNAGTRGYPSLHLCDTSQPALSELLF